MNLKLIERFIQAMMPPEGKSTVNTAFKSMTDPSTAVPTVGLWVGQFQQRLYEGDERVQAEAVKLVLTGIMIAHAVEDASLRKTIVEEFIQRGVRARGENVIDFFDKKAGRKNGTMEKN